MKRSVALVVMSALALLHHVVVAQQAPQQPPPAGRGNAGGLMAVPADAPPPKTTPPGPHAVAIESYASLATHTAYHPANLGGFGLSDRLPIVSWGNGGCARVGTAFSGFLTQVASHGYSRSPSARRTRSVVAAHVVRPQPHQAQQAHRPRLLPRLTTACCSTRLIGRSARTAIRPAASIRSSTRRRSR